MASSNLSPGPDSYTLGPPLPQEMPKPPFRPQAAGTIGFFFSIVAGALVSVISLRRMGYSHKAKKLLWITVLATIVIAIILILIPVRLGRLVGLGLEVVWYFTFPKIQDQEFGQWQATHPDLLPSSGWKALGWAFLGIVMFFAIFMVTGLTLDLTGVAPE
jgi:hypothetical protein